MYKTKYLEFKETVTNTFLETVSAFSNYDGGKIIFGVTDLGDVVGIDNIDQTCLDIENKINDTIVPKPNYSFDLNRNNHTITLIIKKGRQKPFIYKGKAYKRNGTATIEVDQFEMRRLILEGENLSFDELDNPMQDYTFSYLENKFIEAFHLENFNLDILKTLQLYSLEGKYTNAGALFADENYFPGVDIVRFGQSISIILDRHSFEKMSILKQYDETVNVYQRYYQ